jgi:Fe-S-cluster-containing dehydrogenase component/DMSO reductase anchor subunit
LIDDLLAEQQELTAVERFSRAHDSHQARHGMYRDLLPATPPAPGEQYAFEVNLDQCSGCKACVSACHSLNGLDENETWRSVGLLMDVADPHDARRRAQRGFQQHITTACHHCVDPGCVNGCPVLAYDKDPLTGIVRHLDDQCIGCQYCVMMCPYEVPQYSKTRGIVRKCDMCHSRLAVGEAPACVQACPTKAISIKVVEQAKVRAKYRPLAGFTMPPGSGIAARNQFLAASPNPAITLPTTRFVTQRTFPENIFAGDQLAIRRADAHLPLAILLVLSQLAIGASLAATVVTPAAPLLLIASVAGLIALAAGSLHLGQPLKAWRSFLGWRNSWFSREVIALSAFVFLILSATGAAWIMHPLVKYLMMLAAASGVVTITCSAMIYVKTRRDFWNARQAFGKFLGTAFLLGAAAALIAEALQGDSKWLAATAGVLAVAMLLKLAFEQRVLKHLVHAETPTQSPLNKTARLLAGELNGFLRARVAFGVIGGAVLPVIALARIAEGAAINPMLAIGVFALCLTGELLERYLFFTAVVSQKMPGGLAS